MMQLVVEFDDRAPRQQLHAMVGRLQNPRPMLAMLGRSLETYERDAFSTRGYGGWAADDPDTVELKGNGRVLVDSGNLLRQLTKARVVGDSVVVDQGSAFYARNLLDGDRGMPSRDAAPKPQRKHVERWADQVLHYVITGRT